MMALILLEAGEKGFDPLDLAAGGNFLWTFVIFLLALPLMWKVVMGPVARALVERDDHAARAISEAKRASAAAEEARAQVEVALGEARAEAARLMAQARERAESREHEIVEAAKQEAAGLVEGARKAIRAEQDKAISQIRNEVVELSLAAASRVLEREAKSEDDRRIVSELISAREVTAN